MDDYCAFSIYNLLEMSQITQKMYRHPFTVSNTVRDINSNIIAMHRSMKDVALSRNEIELENAITAVNKLEQKVIEDFNIVFERFLGDQSDVKYKYNMFIEWKKIRDEVITLVRQGNKKDAAEITKYKGAIYVKNLTSEMNDLIEFANNKAVTFFNHAQAEEKKSIYILMMLLVVILIFSIYISNKITTNIIFALNILSNGLDDFFSFLGSKSENISDIEYKNSDEFGQMIGTISQ